MNSRLHIVLVRPIYARNIGMCARAMANMGAAQLHLVAPVLAENSAPESSRVPLTDASPGGFSSEAELELRQGAAGAQEVLQNRRVYSSLQEFYAANEDGVRIALSARESGLRHPHPLQEYLARLSASENRPLQDSTRPIYLIFGPEDDGLSATDMELAHGVCYLPTYGSFKSLNLSHAVLLTLALVQAQLGGVAEPRAVRPSPPAQKTFFPEHTITQWLEAVGFDLSAQRKNAAKVFCRILLENAPTPDELRILESILQQNIRKLREL